MKAFIAMLMMGWAMAGLAACQTGGQYDGVSRFAGSGYWDTYYGAGSPPKDS